MPHLQCSGAVCRAVARKAHVNKHNKTKKMTTTTTDAAPLAWTELEYSALCRSPYLTAPVYVPEETDHFLCREDGTREKHRRTWVVYRPAGAAEDGEWDDDPTVGLLQVSVLGDGEEQVRPAETVYLGVAADSFVRVEREDECEIVFDFNWPYGDVEIVKAQHTSEGWAVRKDAFGDSGLPCRLTPRRGTPFTLCLQTPHTGFVIESPDGKRVTGEAEISAESLPAHTYSFTGDGSNDRFQLSLDDNRLNYMCVLTSDGRLSVRDMRDRMALVMEIDAQGPLDTLFMGAHTLLVKNRNDRWRITAVRGVTGDAHGYEQPDVDGVSLSRHVFSRYQSLGDGSEDTLADSLMAMERAMSFQWMWLKEDDWSHERLEGLIDMDGIDEDHDKMMRQALLYNRYDAFMRRLCACSYAACNTLQGDQLQARNNKRKIARCVRHVLAHRAGEEDIWTLEEEARKEILYFFSTFHREFVAALEGR